MTNKDQLENILTMMEAEAVTVSEYCVSFTYGGKTVDIQIESNDPYHEISPLLVLDVCDDT